MRQAVERGEIAESAATEELWDLLPGYLIYRSIIPGRPPTRETVQTLVDGFLMPGSPDRPSSRNRKKCTPASLVQY